LSKFFYSRYTIQDLIYKIPTLLAGHFFSTHSLQQN
jgi:hypothetical protein